MLGSGWETQRGTSGRAVRNCTEPGKTWEGGLWGRQLCGSESLGCHRYLRLLEGAGEPREACEQGRDGISSGCKKRT